MTICEDTISRQAALDCFTATKLKKFDFILHAREEIKKLPPVTPQEPRKGYWVGKDGKPSHLRNGMTMGSVWCSECNKWLTSSDEYSCFGKYCPNCGAKMQEVEG